MKTLTPRQIGEKFSKDAKFINEIFMDLDFISRDKNGFKLTKKGENFGGEQKNYMGKFYVAWDEKILSNKLFLKLINSDETPEQNSDENDLRHNIAQKAGISCVRVQKLSSLIGFLMSLSSLLMKNACR